MVLCMVGHEIEGKKATATPRKKKVKVTKIVTPRKVRVNNFRGNVTVTEVIDDDNAEFNTDSYVSFIVSIDTKTPAQSQRKSTLKGGSKVKFYNPNTYDKTNLANEVKEQLGDNFETFSGAVHLRVNIYRKIPNNERNIIEKGDYYTKRPDIDNLQKFIFDSLDGLFYDDDSQVCNVQACKQYDDHDHVEIVIATLKKPKVVMDDDNDSIATDEAFSVVGKFIENRRAAAMEFDR